MSDTVETGAVVLRERYELLDVLGADGQAHVVKALDHEHARLVALNIRPAANDRARRARVLCELSPHPLLPVVRESFVDGDRDVLVIDWVAGTDLAKLLADRGAPGLPLSSVLAYLADAAAALTFLHGQDPPVVHGDVKPANLILTRGGRVKLVDYGLDARSGDDSPYAAAGPPTRAGDVYSLAATALALLTGAPPGGPDPAWDGLDPDQAARVQAAISAGLAEDPGRRPASAEELVERLRSGWASTLPTGVMTFCMSDIEGSTALWERQPAAMAEAVVRHDELIAGVVEAHGGRFVRSLGEDDSVASVFESATDAVSAAIDAARVLSEEPWPDGIALRARFGLHTGEASLRSGTYYGPTPSLAVRVRAQAGAGEVLLSETTGELVRDQLPPGYGILDLGPHRLAGIEHPEAIKALTGPGLPTAPTAVECPYRGLLAFAPEDRHLFFGREEEAAEVLARIARGRLLAVIGASGSGKSSLLRAAVVAAVDAGELPSAATARLFTPGVEPPVELGGDARELLVVDQFEELYTQCHDRDRRTRFIAALLAHPGPVVIGARADFYGELISHAGLASAVAGNQVLLGPMGEDNLRRAIAEPARLTGLRLEPGLVDVVLADVAGEPGALPLMSHALRETWERRDGRTLTVAAYRDSGGVSSAVAQTADAVADAIPETERPLLRSVFLRLTELGDDVEDTRRRARIDELVPEGTDAGVVRALLEKLSDARLITLDEGTAEVAHEVLIRRWPTLRRWLDEDREGIRLHRRLSDAASLWAASGREPTDLYRGTRLDAAVEWERAKGELLNAAEREFLAASVAEAVRVEQAQLKANRLLRRALAGSGALLLAAIALLVFALSSRQQAVNAQARSRSQVLAGESEGQLARDPQRALLLARAALKAAPTADAQLATSEALDANTAVSQLPSFGKQGCLTANFLFLFDAGRLAADNTCDGYVVFGDLATRRIVSRIRVGPTSTDMIRTADGRTLIVASGRNLMSLDVASGQVRKIYTAPFPIWQVAGGPPARYLAIADTDTVGVVDLRTGRLRVVAHGDASANVINGMMPASAHVLLIVTTGQTRGHGDLYPGVTALNVVTGARRTVVLEKRPNLAAVNFLRVSPDTRTWYFTGAEITALNNAQVAATWAVNPATGRVKWVAQGPRGAFASPIQVSPDNRLVAVGYSSGASDVLDGATGRLVVREASSASIAAGDLAIPAGDGTLVTVSLDGVFRTWATHGSERIRLQAPATPTVGFTPDGTDLVLIGNRGEILDGRTGALVRTFPGFPAASVFNTCSSACFAQSTPLRWLTYLDPRSATPRIVEVDALTGRRASEVSVPRLDAQAVGPDGAIATAYVDSGQLVASVIDPRTGHAVHLPAGPSSPGCAATTPSFTPDGRLMAIDDGCITVDVWNLVTGRMQRTIELPDRAAGSGALLTPDGRYVLVAVLGGAFVRANLATGAVEEVPGAQAEGKVIAISPNSRWYAIGRQDGTVDEYDADSLQLVRHHVMDNPIQTLAFSPDSSELAVEDTANVVRVWDTCQICENPVALAALAARDTVRPFTPGERATFHVAQP